MFEENEITRRIALRCQEKRGKNREGKRFSGLRWRCAATVLALCFAGCEKATSKDEKPKSPSNQQTEGSPAVKTIALGSCAHQDKSQPIWDKIVASNPDLFLFTGDNVYADTEDMTEMRAVYAKLAAKPGYQKLLETCPVLAVWDDHDYGLNDAGKEYKMKVGSEAIFHEFFKTPPESEALSRPGIYRTRYFGPPGKRLQIILLDTRYFRDALTPLQTKSPHGPYDRNRDPATTILGAAQWTWLEEQLQKPADFRIIVSSIQVLPQDHHWELWENFPHERVRLLGLIKNHLSKPILFVSGDRHMGEIMKLKTSDPLSPGFPVYELTSSGLTNAGGGRKGEPNRHRVSPINFQSRNFGLIHIDWEKKSTTLELRDVEGKTVDQFEMSFR